MTKASSSGGKEGVMVERILTILILILTLVKEILNLLN